MCHPASACDLGDETEGEAEIEDEAERTTTSVLSTCNAQQLTTTLIAYHRRKRKREAFAHEVVSSVRRALAGESGRSECLDKIEQRYPDIGNAVEQVCEEKGIGADAWRSDSALTINRAQNRRKAGETGNGFTGIWLALKQRGYKKLSYSSVLAVGEVSQHQFQH